MLARGCLGCSRLSGLRLRLRFSARTWRPARAALHQHAHALNPLSLKTILKRPRFSHRVGLNWLSARTTILRLRRRSTLWSGFTQACAATRMPKRFGGGAWNYAFVNWGQSMPWLRALLRAGPRGGSKSVVAGCPDGVQKTASRRRRREHSESGTYQGSPRFCAHSDRTAERSGKSDAPKRRCRGTCGLFARSQSCRRGACVASAASGVRPDRRTAINIAALYRQKDLRPQESEFLRRAITIQERDLGPSNAELVSTLMLLATSYEKQNQEDNAYAALTRATAVATAVRLREISTVTPLVALRLREPYVRLLKVASKLSRRDLKERKEFVDETLPIRLLPTPTTCRVLPRDRPSCRRSCTADMPGVWLDTR